MLNELHQLANALKARGLLSSSTHSNIKRVGKNECLLFKINENKKPTEIIFLSKKEAGILWRHINSKQNSFPAITLKNTILKKEESEIFYKRLKENYSKEFEKLKLNEKIELLKLLNFNNINYNNKLLIISEWSLSKLKVINNSKDPNLESLRKLIERFPKSEEDSNIFTDSLVEFIKQDIDKLNDEYKANLLKYLLVGNFDHNKKISCMIYFDVADIEKYPCTVRNPATKAALVKSLNLGKKDEQSISSSGSRKCALTGKGGLNLITVYPQPNLDPLGDTPLYSKFDQIPCFTRYNMIGSNAFPASEHTVTEMNDALEFLTNPKREKKTWKKTLSSNKDELILLLAYLAEDPDNDTLLADILDDPSDTEENEMTFEQLCEQVLRDVKGISQKNPNSKINLIILEKHDIGRKQIAYSNSFSVQRFCENLKNWEEGSKNSPSVYLTNIKESIRKFSSPICATPKQICRVLKINYMRGLKNISKKSSAITTSEIYDLYMPKNNNINKNFILSVLQKTLTRSEFLFQYIRSGNLIVSDKYILNDFRIFISLISILLWKLNIKKENYMTTAAFNIGRLLQLADILHREYCVQVRNGGDKSKALPGQLIGNDHLLVATENPNEGLNRLSARMQIYIAWAKSYDGENSNLVKWVLMCAGKACAKISEKEIPKSFDSAERAQVFLGYLAAIPSEKKQVANESNNLNENSENE